MNKLQNACCKYALHRMPGHLPSCYILPNDNPQMLHHYVSDENITGITFYKLGVGIISPPRPPQLVPVSSAPSSFSACDVSSY
jgi:hypothetical protein